MKTVIRWLGIGMGILQCGTLLLAQAQTSSQAIGTIVPRLVNFSGRATDVQGKAIVGAAGVTFAIYKAQYDGSPLWLETQNVQTDTKGNYTVQLGATKAEGLPLQLFSSGAGHWLGVSVNGEAELPRVLLLSVPYALKAADAQTLGGLPPSAFVLAVPGNSNALGAASPLPPSGGRGNSADIGGSGTQNFIPIWADNSGDLGNSVLFQLGSGASAKIGINLTKPLFTLDVNGSELMRGLFEMATTGFATPTKGFNSQPFNLESSAYNSGTAKYTLNHFQWQAEPTGNNTANPSATLDLLFGTDPNQPAETGLKLSNTGLFTFAPGQTFPGTGTITGITAGTDLNGGGTSGFVTLNLDTTKVPQLATANSFAATQTISSGDLSLTSGALVLSASTDSTHGVIRQQGNPIIHTCCFADNIFVGLVAGNFSNTGSENTGVGRSALSSLTSGGFNTALGSFALAGLQPGITDIGVGGTSLLKNTIGSFNTAIGTAAMLVNIDGNENTAVGDHRARVDDHRERQYRSGRGCRRDPWWDSFWFAEHIHRLRDRDRHRQRHDYRRDCHRCQGKCRAEQHAGPGRHGP